jgi:hypothetical protein
MFEAGVNATLDRYRKLLNEVREGHVDLPNVNCDVGEYTGPGKYRLNDETHAKLLDKLADGHFMGASSQLREELLRFFAEPDAPYATKRDVKAWAKVQIELEQLKSAAPVPVVGSAATGPSGLMLPSLPAPLWHREEIRQRGTERKPLCLKSPSGLCAL